MRKLAIAGSGGGTRHLAPFDDLDFDIWIFNEAATSEWCKRWDACFQLHKPEIYTGHNTKDPNHWHWLQQKRGKPIYMQEADPHVPDAVRYPLDDALKLSGLRYLTSTISYALALAYLQGYEQIDIYGVEMSFSEYQYQAECYRFWIGFLKGAGVEVNLYSGQTMFEALLYGYEGNFALGSEYFKERAAILDAEWKSAEKHLQGTLKAIGRAIEKQDGNKIPDLVQTYQTAAMTCGEKAGALAEAERYASFGDRYADRGGFEFAAATAQRDGEAKKILTYSALGKVEYVWNAWMQTKAEQAARQMDALIKQAGQLAYDTGAMLGMYQENVGYILKYDAMATANGKAK